MKDKFSKWNKVEMRIYEMLGVKLFQKMTFILEKIIHRKDGGQNQNYHFNKNSSDKADLFIKFLFYNGIIHVRNLIFLGIYFTIKILFFSIKFYDALFVISGIKDIYCVMLQRYNFLRIKKYIEYKKIVKERRILKRAERIKVSVEDRYDCSYAKYDLDIVRTLLKAIQNKEAISLSTVEIDVLQRIKILLNDRGGKKYVEKR